MDDGGLYIKRHSPLERTNSVLPTNSGSTHRTNFSDSVISWRQSKVNMPVSQLANRASNAWSSRAESFSDLLQRLITKSAKFTGRYSPTQENYNRLNDPIISKACCTMSTAVRNPTSSLLAVKNWSHYVSSPSARILSEVFFQRCTGLVCSTNIPLWNSVFH